MAKESVNRFVVTSTIIDETVIQRFAELPQAMERFGVVCFMRGASNRRGVIRVRSVDGIILAECDLSKIKL